MKIKTTIFIICAVLLSCRKDNGPAIILNGTLSTCPTNSTCSYSYYESADFTGSSQPIRGGFRVFMYSFNQNSCGPNALLSFKTSINNNYFDISSSQIAQGLVAGYTNGCPCCEYFAQVAYPKPIGGEIKGKRLDATHWLINATVIMGSSVISPVDTVVVNQYFNLEKLP